MIIDIKVPPAGESVTEAEIAFWHKEDGDIVELDEPLVELETEKASQEVCAEAAGKLSIKVEAGTTVKVGAVIATLDTAVAPSEEVEEDTVEPEPEAPAKTPEPAVAEEPVVAMPKQDAEPAQVSEPVVASEAPAEAEEEFDYEDHDSKGHPLYSAGMKKVPSPAARRLMVLNGISSQDVRGTGRDGRITKGDVLRYLKHREKQLKIPSTVSLKAPELKELREEAAKVAKAEEARAEKKQVETPKGDSGDGVRRERMSMMRRTIANRLVEAQQTAAILTTFNEIDMYNVMELRKTYKESFKKKYDVNLGFLSFFAKAVAIGLREFPVINAQIHGEDIVYHDFVNLGIAVSTPKGLMVPVIKNVQDLGFHEIEKQISELAVKGREGKINLDDLSGGTFTITNGGVFGSMLSTPILNRPQSGILGMHNIVQRPWVVDGEIKVRPIMYVALSYDHRLIDGAQAVRFLVTVKECIEDPSRIMLEI